MLDKAMDMLDGPSTPKPHVTVVVTAFDRKLALRKLLRSLNEQSVSRSLFEVIVVDDSENENIAHKAADGTKAEYDLSIKKTGLSYEANGVSIARNIGIKAARGDVIISIDDDCIPNRCFVEEHILAHKTNAPIIALGHRSQDRAKLKEIRPVSVTEPRPVNELRSSQCGCLNFTNFLTGNISFPKKIAEEVGLFNESFAQVGEHGWEDIEFGYRLWRRGYRMVFAGNALVYRPTTEKEKEERRQKEGAVEKGFQRFVSLQPMVPEVVELVIALAAGRLEMARPMAEHILENDPNHFRVLVILGDIYFKSKRYGEALDCFMRAKEINDCDQSVDEKIGRIVAGGCDRGEIEGRSACSIS